MMSAPALCRSWHETCKAVLDNNFEDVCTCRYSDMDQALRCNAQLGQLSPSDK